jgi:hypothetical protein
VLGLTIKVSVFNEAGTVKIGGTQYPVDTGKMAITYTIRDWPFDSYDNTLNLRTGVQTPGAGGSIANRELFLFNGASWTFASTATIPAPYDSVRSPLARFPPTCRCNQRSHPHSPLYMQIMTVTRHCEVEQHRLWR